MDQQTNNQQKSFQLNPILSSTQAPQSQKQRKNEDSYTNFLDEEMSQEPLDDYSHAFEDDESTYQQEGEQKQTFKGGKRTFKDDLYLQNNMRSDNIAKYQQFQTLARQPTIPTHRQQKRPVSILKNKKTVVRGFSRSTAAQFWDPNNDLTQQREGGQSTGVNNEYNTIVETNFFECKEVTNCEFIYERSEKSVQRAGLLDTISKMFTRQLGIQNEITALCAIKDLLVIGFSNGVLLLFDTDKLEIVFTHKHFTKNDKSIDKLKLFHYDGNKDESLTLLLSLSDGLLTYHHFPKISLIDELVIENNIVDFMPYNIARRPYLATVHKSKELKIFRLRKRLEYTYLTKIQLDQRPLSFIVYRDVFIFTYRSHSEYIRIEAKGKEQEAITRINLWQNDEPQHRFLPYPVFDESIQAFVITREDYSFYMDLRGVYDVEFNKIKWSDHVMHVEVVRPYLVGFLPTGIEIKNIFNPNRVVQKIELLQSSISCHTVALNHINMRELDSLYILLNRRQTNIKVLLKATQIDPRVQINMLIERKLYSTGLKFCDFLLENNFEGMTRDQYEKLQREKGFYNFIVKRRYFIAKEIFKEFKVPLQMVILLFAEIYPQIFITKLIEMFEINIKEIPYFEIMRQQWMRNNYAIGGGQAGIFEYKADSRKDTQNQQYFTMSNHEHNQALLRAATENLDQDKLQAMREFLIYFLKKRDDLIAKIEQLSLIDKRGNYFPQQQQFSQFNQGLSPTGHNEYFFPGVNPKSSATRRKSFDNPGVYGSEAQNQQPTNPFDLQVIPDKGGRIHQSDNENTNAKISQLFYLRIMTEIFLFHAMIILIKSEQEKDKLQILRNEFYSLIKNDNALPPDFCQEVFFSYQMHDEMLLFLFYRKQYKELLLLVQKEFEKASNSGDKDMQRYWVSKFIKYCKKINELGIEDYAIQHSEWMFKIDIDLGLECIKKFNTTAPINYNSGSMSPSKHQALQHKYEPFKSEKVLRHIKEQGGLKACLKYLEYLTLECNIKDRPIHTELACLYVQYLNLNLQNYLISEKGDTKIDQIRADNDQIIFELRKKLISFLENSDYFDSSAIMQLMPPDYLLKEKVILLAKSKQYKEAFIVCIDQLCDIDFAIQVAHRAFKQHNEKSVYFQLFVRLLQSNERESALQVLKENFHFIQFDQVTNFIPDTEDFDHNLNKFYQKAFVEMEKVTKELQILKSLTDCEYLACAEELYKCRNEYFVIREETCCNSCGKKINNYPFYYLPKSKEIIHYYCFLQDNDQMMQSNEYNSPNKLKSPIASAVVQDQ